MKCLICNRELKNPKSVQMGIGPTCWAKIHNRPAEENNPGQTMLDLLNYPLDEADTSPGAMAFYAERMTDLAGYDDWYREALREAIEEYNAD